MLRPHLRRGFVLPLVLIFLLVGGALISVSLDLATNSQNQTMNMVTSQELYNAAQSGIEWAKAQLLEHREDLDWTVTEDYSPVSNNLSTLYATYDDDGNAGTPNPRVWDDTVSEDLNARYLDAHIQVSVEILNCHYSVAYGTTPSAADKLPPLIPPSSPGSSPGQTPSMNFTNGTTVIMDPYRVTSSGGGGSTGHSFVIRATARDLTTPNRSKTLETMVVIQG